MGVVELPEGEFRGEGHFAPPPDAAARVRAELAAAETEGRREELRAALRALEGGG